MILFILSPMVVGVIAAVLAPRLALRMRPRAAAVGLVIFSLVVALATGAAMCLAAIIGVRLLVPSVRPDDWPTERIRDLIPLPPHVGVAAGIAAAVALSAVLLCLTRSVSEHRAARAMIRPFTPDDDVVVFEDDRVFAVAVAGRQGRPGRQGRQGRIVVSRAVMTGLPADERDAVLEHERAHLRHHHHVYSRLMRVAAAANPLVRPLVPALDLALERWADEDAVRAVTNPMVVVSAMAKAGPAPLPGRAMSARPGDVVERARQLLEPTRSPVGLIVLTAATLIAVAGFCFGVYDVNAVIELAERLGPR